MDFMFMGEEGGSRTLAMLVVKERSTKAVMACVTPAKSCGQFLGKRVLAFMREFGCELEAVTVKTDNDPALFPWWKWWPGSERRREESRWRWKTAQCTAARESG